MSFTIKFQKFLDKYVFAVLCFFIGLFKFPERLSKVNKILIIKPWALGDSVVLLPALFAIKKQFPNAELHVLAHPQRNRPAFEGHKFIDKIIDWSPINILKLFRKYDLAIDAEPFLNVMAVVAFIASPYRLGFSHGIRSRTYHEKIVFRKDQHMVQNYLDFARKLGGKYDTDSLIPLSISRQDQKIAEKFLKDNEVNKGDFLIGIAPSVAESVKYRMWPLENMAKFIDAVIEKHKAKIIFPDSRGNRKLVQEIQSMTKHKSIDACDLNLGQRAAIIKRCNVFVSNDSGLMHLAAAEGTRTIGLFGPNTPVLWGPYGKKNLSIWKPKKGCPFIDNTNPKLVPDNLTKEQLTCMDAIKVEDVLNAVGKIKNS